MGDVISAERIYVSEEAYHLDPCKVPSLSSSMAKVLLDKSPLHAWHRHPRLGAGERQESKTFDSGKLAHKLLLGKGAEVVVVDAIDWRTKAAQTARDEAYASGRIPCLVGDFAEAEEASRVIRQRLERAGISLVGESEAQVTWLERVPGHADVHARGMLDHFVKEPRSLVIYDLKTSRSAHPRACAAHVVEYGYDIQRAAYTRAIEALMPEYAGRVDFIFIFAETTAPYAVTCGRLDAVLRERGERRWARAVDLWAECLAFRSWPAYADRPITIEAPPWALAQMQEQES